MSNNNRLVFTGNSISTLVNIYTPGSGVGAQSISIRRKLRNKAARFFDEDINNGPTENGPMENGPTENGSTENGPTDIDFSNYNYTSNPNFFNQSGQYLQTQSIVTNMVYGGIGNNIHRVSATSISNDGSVVCFGMDFYRDPIDLIDNIGLVQVYKYDGNTWVQLGTNIEGNIMNDKVGTSTAMNNDGTIIAVSGSGPALNGNTNIYKYSTPGQVGGVWEQLGSTLTGVTHPNIENLGLKCDLDSTGSIIVLGTRSDSVKIYKYSTPGQLGGGWEQLGNTLSNISVETVSGMSNISVVSINGNGNIICVGSPSYADTKGLVNVYQYSSPGQLGGTWSPVGASIEAERYTGDKWGSSVSINNLGTIIACGATYTRDGAGGEESGHVRIFQYSGGSWSKIGQDIDGESANSKSGNDVSLSANGLVVAIGAYEHDEGGVDRIGQVRVYRYNIDIDTWVQVGVDLNGSTEQQHYGFKLNLNEDGSRLVIGSLNGTERIVVYKYD
jgi:hypothetical protein